jgi:hypothetical protein
MVTPPAQAALVISSAFAGRNRITATLAATADAGAPAALLTVLVLFFVGELEEAH